MRHFTVLFLAAVVILVILSNSHTGFTSQKIHTPSTVISDIIWDFNSHIEHARGSDNWPVTWADDDNLYTSWGDGGGFGGTNSDGRVSLGVARVEGAFDNYNGYNVWGGKIPENSATFSGKSYGILSIDGALYMWVMVEGNYFSKSELYYSNNHGASLTTVGWKFENLGGAFSVPTFLNFGKDYQGARDDYVYIYAPGAKNGTFTSTDTVDLARVPKDQIKNQASYQFFAGLDDGGNPNWTSDINNRVPVFNYPGKVHWTMSVGYNPGIRRYLLFNNSRPNPSQSKSTPGDLEIFDASEPWGPWTKVVSYQNWGDFGYTFSYFLVPKWLSGDGRDFTLVFSGTGGNDSWNTVNGRFVLNN